jgi:hypothetical protein
MLAIWYSGVLGGMPMSTSKETVNKLAIATASINFSKLQSVASAGGDLIAAVSKVQEERLISASCFAETDAKAFNEAYTAEFLRLSAIAAEYEAKSETSIGIQQDEPNKPGGRKIDRLAVRQLVIRDSEEMQACAMMGGNSFQLSLDQKDAVNAQIEHLSDDDKLAFLNVYNEELSALNSQMKQKLIQIKEDASKIDAKIMADNESAAIWGKVAGVFILIVLTIFLFTRK